MILNDVLRNDPGIREASADFESAKNRIEQSRSAHWPKIVATGIQPISQDHRSDDTTSKNFEPGLSAEFNLYSFGAIEFDIEKNRHNAEYYRYKLVEKYEETAYDIILLYLDALRDKKAIEVLKKSLQRHINILKDLSSIILHDKGRESEYVQANARKLLVEQQMNSRRLALETTLSKISTFTQNSIRDDNIDDVFDISTIGDILIKYENNIKLNNPSYMAQQENLESKKMELISEQKSALPKLDINGTITRNNKEISINLKWDLFNRSTSFNIDEKINQVAAASGRFDYIVRQIDESRKLSEITIKQTIKDIYILRKQIKESERVVDFYKLQFQIARKTLIEVLNSQNELSNVELQYVESQHRLNRGVLDFLRSQGGIMKWCCSNTNHNFKK
ncbi:outer membrane efflux protein [Escherichia coli]|uniref:TolC family protein n=1 Tax=Escherichia coli TaxID=562 RepID=UPI0019184C17|nr:TolC family protein [Escherichia coli]CAD5757996.1 outer membrane efflux protein [Escherichia coli]